MCVQRHDHGVLQWKTVKQNSYGDPRQNHSSVSLMQFPQIESTKQVSSNIKSMFYLFLNYGNSHEYRLESTTCSLPISTRSVQRELYLYFYNESHLIKPLNVRSFWTLMCSNCRKKKTPKTSSVTRFKVYCFFTLKLI